MTVSSCLARKGDARYDGIGVTGRAIRQPNVLPARLVAGSNLAAPPLVKTLLCADIASHAYTANLINQQLKIERAKYSHGHIASWLVYSMHTVMNCFCSFSIGVRQA